MKQNQLILIKNIFETNHLNYRFREQPQTHRMRIQVSAGQEEKAAVLLRQNGILLDPVVGAKRISRGEFWKWLGLAVLLIVLLAFLINYSFK